MNPSAAWFHRCWILLAMCCAVALLNTGCCSTTKSSNPGGVASAKAGSPANSGSSWNWFAPEPKKVQTPSDFIAQPRPQ